MCGWGRLCQAGVKDWSIGFKWSVNTGDYLNSASQDLMMAVDSTCSADILGMFANTRTVNSLIYAKMMVTQNHCLLRDDWELQGRACQSQCTTCCTDSHLDELSQMRNGNLRKVMEKRNKWGLTSGNKLLPLSVLRRKARPSWLLYLILSLILKCLLQ